MPSLSKTLLPEEKFPVSIKLLLLVQAGSVFSKDAAQLANPQLLLRRLASSRTVSANKGRGRCQWWGELPRKASNPRIRSCSKRYTLPIILESVYSSRHLHCQIRSKKKRLRNDLVLSRSDMQSRLSQRGQRFQATKSPAHVAGQEQPQSSNDGCTKLHPTAKPSL